MSFKMKKNIGERFTGLCLCFVCLLSSLAFLFVLLSSFRKLDGRTVEEWDAAFGAQERFPEPKGAGSSEANKPSVRTMEVYWQGMIYTTLYVATLACCFLPCLYAMCVFGKPCKCKTPGYVTVTICTCLSFVVIIILALGPISMSKGANVKEITEWCEGDNLEGNEKYYYDAVFEMDEVISDLMYNYWGTTSCRLNNEIDAALWSEDIANKYWWAADGYKNFADCYEDLVSAGTVVQTDAQLKALRSLSFYEPYYSCSGMCYKAQFYATLSSVEYGPPKVMCLIEQANSSQRRFRGIAVSMLLSFLAMVCAFFGSFFLYCKK